MVGKIKIKKSAKRKSLKKTNEIYWNSGKVEEKLSNSREKMVRSIEINRNLSRSYAILVKYGENP